MARYGRSRGAPGWVDIVGRAPEFATRSLPRWTVPSSEPEPATLLDSVGSIRSAGVGESPAAARALAVPPAEDRRERAGLRQRHDRPERQRRAVGVVAI